MNVIVTQVSQVEAGAEGRVLCGAVGMQQLQASVDARLVYRAGQIQIGGVATRQYGALSGKQAGVDRGDFMEKRSEEHTSELQSLMRISYAVFCLKKKKEHIQ